MSIEITLADFTNAYAAGEPVIDVRSAEEYVAAHVPGAVLIPLEQLATRVEEVPAGRVHVICASGNRSKVGTDILRRAGRDAWSVAGGTSGWQAAGNRVVTGLSAS